ncbi:hypothetical protein R1sor_012598 [Riccia sorocarpa]|uniref:DUF4218 domain-containing protein n=1 Tax=Riccia sorocarpa TaxID=122646 RepID=A0ABD3I486_9MARC
MRSIADSPTTRYVENAYHEMADNPRAVRLGMATDGFSRVSFSRKSYSIWPVMFINYNIPPWLSTKKGHILLSLIIPGPKKPSNFDVYMGPVVDELKLLWTGVSAYDARLTCPEEQRRFTLNDICLWIIHDSPGLGIVSGLQVSGTRGCPTCGMNLESKYNKHLKTTIYMGHKRYLSQTSHMRGDCTTPKPPVTHFTDWYVLEYEIQQGVQQRAQSGLNRIPLLTELPYYDVTSPRISFVICLVMWTNCITVELVKSSTYTRKLGHIGGLMEQRVRDMLHGCLVSRRGIYSARESAKSVRLLAIACILLGAFQHADDKIWGKGMKTHDYHKLIHDILPLVIHGLGSEELWEAIYALSRLFRWVCAKEINMNEVSYMEEFSSETLCLLAQALPPSFFVGQTHWVLHLVREVGICGLVHNRWMYFVERYMRVLNEFIRQNVKMEGSIAEGYLVMEDMFYGSEFLSRLDPGAPLSSMADFENEKELGEVPYGASIRKKMDKTMLHQAHVFVLHNAEGMQSWLDRYSMDHPPNRRNRPTFLGYMGEMQKLSDQGQLPSDYPDINDDITNIIIGPYVHATFWSQCWTMGRHFWKQLVDVNITRMSDNGMSCSFIQNCQASSVDQQLIEGHLPYSGHIQQIVEVNFSITSCCFIALGTRCRWWVVVRQL